MNEAVHKEALGTKPGPGGVVTYSRLLDPMFPP